MTPTSEERMFLWDEDFCKINDHNGHDDDDDDEMERHKCTCGDMGT